MEAAAPVPPDPTSAGLPRPKRRPRWWLRIPLLLLVLVVLLVLVAPMAANFAFVRQRLQDQLQHGLGVPCRLDKLHFSWFSGLELGGLEIGNATGFAPDHPFLQLGSLRGDLSILRLATGRIDISGTIADLEVRIDQDAEGRTNVGTIFGIGARRGGSAGGPGGPGIEVGANDRFDLGAVRFDLELADALVEIRREGRLLESLRDLDCRLEKEFGTDVLKVKLDSRLAPTAPDGQEGSLHLRANVDAATKVVDAGVETIGFDLARYQPLADAFLEPGNLTQLGGIATGKLRVRARGTTEVDLGGDMAVEQPRLAGALLRGMSVAAPRWTLQPALQLKFGRAGELPAVDAGRFAFDLGFARLQGLAAESVAKALGGRPGLGFAFDLDLDQLAAFGGPLPEQVRSAGGRIEGTLAVPLQGSQLPAWHTLLANTVLDAQLDATSVKMAGFDLSGFDGTLTMRDGDLVLAAGEGTRLNMGSLAVTVKSNLRDLSTVPLELAVDWQGGHVAGQTSQLLRYAVPVLAGLQETAEFASAIDLKLQLRGPALRQPGQNWLQWLDQWSGSGDIGLRDGSFAPAPALADLLHAFGQERHLAIDSLTGGFTMHAGKIESKAMRWLSKGREYGLSGRVSLDGALAVGLDLTAMLQQHKDGRRIAALLGDQKLQARLTGTVDAPALGLPDLGKLLQDAAAKQGKELLEKQGEELLKKGLESIFKRSKKN
jgi:hypothetical protein